MIPKVKDCPHFAAQANIRHPPAAFLQSDNQSGLINRWTKCTTPSAWQMELAFVNIQDKHLASDLTRDVSQNSQGDGGRLAVGLGLAVVPGRHQPKSALCLWRGENNGTHHRSFAAQRTERAGFYRPYCRPRCNCLAWSVCKTNKNETSFPLFGFILGWQKCSVCCRRDIQNTNLAWPLVCQLFRNQDILGAIDEVDMGCRQDDVQHTFSWSNSLSPDAVSSCLQLQKCMCIYVCVDVCVYAKFILLRNP